MRLRASLGPALLGGVGFGFLICWGDLDWGFFKPRGAAAKWEVCGAVPLVKSISQIPIVSEVTGAIGVGGV